MLTFVVERDCRDINLSGEANEIQAVYHITFITGVCVFGLYNAVLHIFAAFPVPRRIPPPVSMDPGVQIFDSFCLLCLTRQKTEEAAASSASAVATALPFVLTQFNVHYISANLNAYVSSSLIVLFL